MLVEDDSGDLQGYEDEESDHGKQQRERFLEHF